MTAAPENLLVPLLAYYCVVLLIPLALFLMKGKPQQSARWDAGMSIAALLAVAYVSEEIFWIVQRKGRPCSSCGQKIHLKPFSVRIHCPYCGKMRRCSNEG